MDIKLEHLFQKRLRILWHVLFWTGYLSFYVLISSFSTGISSQRPVGQMFMQYGITIWVDILAAYFTVYFLMPKFLFKRKYFLFFLFFILSSIVFIFLQRTIVFYITYPVFYPDVAGNYTYMQFNPFYSFMNIYTVVGLVAAIKLLKYWFQNQQLKSDLENRNMAAELAMLRSQINPHFLFNTLNNIDTLVEEDPAQASDSIIKLSDIMRYMLYDANNENVLLSNEIEYLESYISLQQLRIHDQEYIRFETKGDYPNRNIAPMLFIPFVENAFKHGKKNVISPGVTILLEYNRQFIKFEVKNYYDEPDSGRESVKEGIGLKNIRRRLELLYPDKHDLGIRSNNGVYHVMLIIYDR